MGIEVREVGADDWREWRTLRLAALAEAPSAFGSRLADWEDAPEDRWRERLSVPNAIDLVAVDGRSDGSSEEAADAGRTLAGGVGMASGVPVGETPGRAELVSMWVAPVARRRGVASRLVETVASWAVRSGFDELALSVVTGDSAARRTYERLGFATTDEPIETAPGEPDEIVMVRDLRSERTLDTYERTADRYVEGTTSDRAGLVDDLLARVLPGSSVLELGSGPGRDALALEAAGLRVQRSDGARSFVERLRREGHPALVLDVLRDDLGGPYDAVFANAVLLHVPRDRFADVLTRVLDALVPGGLLAVTLKAGTDAAWSTAKTGLPRHFTYWEAEPLRRAATDAGWTDVDVRDSTRPDSAERWLTLLARRP